MGLLLACITLGGAVLAQPAPVPEAEKALEAEIAEFFRKFDADKDARVTCAEVRKAMAEESGDPADSVEVVVAAGDTVCLCLSADADDDGFVSRAEYRVLRARKTADPRYKPPLSRADVDQLKKEQFAPVLKLLLEDADADKDGKLSEAEYKSATGETGAFGKADADGNGYLTPAEIEAQWLAELRAAFELPDDKKAAPGAYGRVGRNWTVRQTSRISGTETISYTRTEVVTLTDKEATLKIQKLDKDRKPVEHGVSESKVALPVAPPAKDAAVETVKVAAGEFECTVSAAGAASKSWFSRKHPGLCVKTTFKDDLSETMTELVEFNE